MARVAPAVPLAPARVMTTPSYSERGATVIIESNSGSPLMRASSLRTRSRSATAARQSAPTASKGAPTMTATLPRRGRHEPARSNARVPRRPTGTTGPPACAAATKAPMRHGRSTGAGPQPGPRAGPCLPQALPPQGGVFLLQLAIFITLAGGVAPYLSARCLQHGARRCQHHFVGRIADHPGHCLVDCGAQLLAHRRSPLAGFGDDHQSLGAERVVAARERGDAALADADERAHRLFQFVRINVVAAADDDVLHPAGDDEFAVGEVTAVAGIQPVVLQ